MKRRLGVLILLVLLLTGCGKQSGGRISRSGAGYQRMAEANGTCYLVELGGNVDTMDWDTGEVSTYWKPTGDVQWMTGDELRTACYLEDKTLHQVELAAGADHILGQLEDVGDLNLIAVTEHYVMFERWNVEQDGQNGVWYVNTETMEERPLFLNEDANLLSLSGYYGSMGISCGEDRLLVLHGTDGTDADADYELLQVDFTTGEKHMVAKLPEGLMAAALRQDTVFYLDSSCTLYSVPLDGSEEPAVRSFAPDVELKQVITAWMNSDGTMIALCGDEETLIYGYDLETDTVWLLEQLGPDTVHGLSRNVSRYAVLFLENGKEQILLDDWNPQVNKKRTHGRNSVMRPSCIIVFVFRFAFSVRHGTKQLDFVSVAGQLIGRFQHLR